MTRDLASLRMRFGGVCAGTGTGKSVGYMTASQIKGGRTIILTATKGQQDQLMREFEPMGLVQIRGRSNYECIGHQGGSCADGQTSRCPHRKSTTCPYYADYMTARNARLVVTNYAYYINANRFNGGLKPCNNLICDEAHLAVQQVESELTVRISVEDLQVLEMGGPTKNCVEAWKHWAKIAAARAATRYAVLDEECYERGYTDEDLQLLKHLSGLARRAGVLAESRPIEWTMQSHDWGFQFDPIRIGRHTEKILWQGTPSVWLVSASLIPKGMFLLGVPQKDRKYFSYPPPFEPERNPVYLLKTLKMNARMDEFDMKLWLNQIDRLIRARTDRKGIIHTVSHYRARYIMQHSRFRHMMMSNAGGNPTDRTIRNYKQAKQPKILVTASVTTGYDFPYDECRYQIISKLPFPPLVDHVMIQRTRADSQYYDYLTMQEFIQMCGRGMRAPDDWCENFVLDDHARWKIYQNAKLLPEGFIKRVKMIDSPPPPLEFAA